jgi:hypothetical protein
MGIRVTRFSYPGWQAVTRLTPIQGVKTDSVVLVRKRTIPTEWPPHVGEVIANFCKQRVSRGQCNGSPRPYSRFSRPEPLLFLPSSSSIVLTRLSGPPSRPPPPNSNYYSFRWPSYCTSRTFWNSVLQWARTFLSHSTLYKPNKKQMEHKRPNRRNTQYTLKKGKVVPVLN